MTMTHVTAVNERNFEDEVLKADKLVLVHFYGKESAVCKSIERGLDEFARNTKALSRWSRSMSSKALI